MLIGFYFDFVVLCGRMLICVHCIPYKNSVCSFLAASNELHCIAQMKIKNVCIPYVCDSCIYVFRLIIRCKVACLNAHGHGHGHVGDLSLTSH